MPSRFLAGTGTGELEFQEYWKRERSSSGETPSSENETIRVDIHKKHCKVLSTKIVARELLSIELFSTHRQI